MTPAYLAAALRAQAHGLHHLEAAADPLIDHAHFLLRNDFTERFIHTATSFTDGLTQAAAIDWPAAVEALNAHELPCSAGEQQVLRLAASLAHGIPVNLRDALTRLDHHNINLVITAILCASGRKRPRSSLAP